MIITIHDPKELNLVQIRGFSLYVEKSGGSLVLYVRNHPGRMDVSKGDNGISLFLGVDGKMEVIDQFKYDCPGEGKYEHQP